MSLPFAPLFRSVAVIFALTCLPVSIMAQTPSEAPAKAESAEDKGVAAWARVMTGQWMGDWSGDWPEDLGSGWKSTGQLTIASDSTSKGISETQGNGQISGALTATNDWFYASVRAKNVKGSDGADWQSALAVGAKWKWHGVSVNTQIIHKINHGARPGVDNRFYEWQTELSRTYDRTTLKLLTIYSPDSSGATEAASYYEAGVSQKLSDKWSLSGAVGTRKLKPARDYTAFSVGATYAFTDTASLDMRAYSTDAKDYSKAHGDRFVVSLQQKF